MSTEILGSNYIFNTGIMARAVVYKHATGKLLVVIQHRDNSENNVVVQMLPSDIEDLKMIIDSPPETAALFFPVSTDADVRAWEKTGEIPRGFQQAGK